MWQVLDSYFKEGGLVRGQTESYNRFTEDLAEVVKYYGEFTIPIVHQFGLTEQFEDDAFWEFKFDSIIYKKAPTHRNLDKQVQKVTPMMCRLRDLNYQL